MNSASDNASSYGILQIHWSFPPTTGGVESHLIDLATLIAGRGHRVVVLTGEPTPVASDGYDVLTTPLLSLPLIRTSALPDSEFVGRFQDLLASVIAQYRIDVVHGHNLHHFHGAPAMAIERLRGGGGLRVFHTFHETWPDILSGNPVYQGWDANYAVSRHVQEQCRAILGFAPTLFPLGINTRVFRADSECLSATGAPVILHPARLLPWKGADIAIRALRCLIDRGCPAQLVITDTQRIIDWDDELATYRATIEKLILDLQLASNVRFTPASYADMPGLYRAADIVVYPTIGDEPYGLVPIEAMSCARPVVASDSGGIAETVVDGVTGYIVPKRDPHALAARLGELIADPQLAREFGRAGRRRAEAVFDSKRYVSELLRHFAQVGTPEPIHGSVAGSRPQ